MIDTVFGSHIRRLRSAVLQGYSFTQIPEWIERHTRLKGQQFSFKDHEYQLQILRDTSRQINVRKCSQVGMSEMSSRAALAMVNIMDGFTVIYTMPTATDSRKFAQTRLDPIISQSDEIKYRLNSAVDNAEVKQFGSSFLHLKGTYGQSAAISVPADVLMHDELDFSDKEVVGSYQSRLTHSPHKITWKFSTPTVPGLGISAEMDVSRRHFNMCKCCHCSHWFLPDYFTNVKIPKYKGELHEVTEHNLHNWRWKEAYVECPKCSLPVDLSLPQRQWVCENTEQQLDAAGYQIQPFDAPAIIFPSDIVLSSLKYSRLADFINFGLGKTVEDKESGLTQEDVDACYVPGGAAGFFTHVMGVDMGLMCHIMIAGVDVEGKLLVVKTERVSVAKVTERVQQLRQQYRVMLTVMDTVPYVETVMRLQEKDPNLWGAIYVDMKDAIAYLVKKREEKPEEGKLDLRQVNVNRSRALDGLMSDIREGRIFFLEDENRTTITAQLQDMKRVKDYTQHNDVQFVWRKTKGNDHFHHTLLYTSVAAKMRGTTVGGAIALPLVGKFKVKEGVT